MSREKQIEEMAKYCPFLKNGKCQGDSPLETDCDLMCKMFGFITNLIQADYRKQEWISVDERLPEETCKCLIVDALGVIYLASYSSRYRAFNATDEDGGDTWRLNSITHWMPLPEPPKMKGDEGHA